MKLTGLRVNVPAGLCTLQIQDSKRGLISIDLSLSDIERAAAEIRRGRLSLERRLAVGELEKKGELQEFPIVNMLSYKVGIEPMRDPPAIVLVIDPDTQLQLAYRLHPEAARELARHLEEQAQSSSLPPRTH